MLNFFQVMIDDSIYRRSNDRTIYKRHAITNRDDHKYRNQLDRADYLVEKVGKKYKRE